MPQEMAFLKTFQKIEGFYLDGIFLRGEFKDDECRLVFTCLFNNAQAHFLKVSDSIFFKCTAMLFQLTRPGISHKKGGLMGPGYQGA